MSRMHVEVCRPGPALESLWQDLIGRGAANVFMAPAALEAAQALAFAKIHVLLAWEDAGNSKRLVGWWALQERTMVPGWPKFLMAPPFRYAIVSDPVVECGAAARVIPAMLEAIQRDPRLPKLIRLQYLDADSEAGGAVVEAVAARHGCNIKLSERARPFASQDSNLKKSGATRKKLRQDWNKLSALGSVDVQNDRTPANARAGFETFLALEANGWKGARGTALLANESDAAFVRALACNLSERHDLSVALLRLDGRAIAAQVLFYCGNMAYTWKTAFDREFAKYSPGALLVEKVTTQVLAMPGVQAIESCSPEGGFMEQLWEGRRTSVDLLVYVGQHRSLGFGILAGRERAYQTLKKARNKVRLGSANRRTPSIAAFAALVRPGLTRAAKS